jgi:hypothetical protein
LSQKLRDVIKTGTDSIHSLIPISEENAEFLYLDDELECLIEELDKRIESTTNEAQEPARPPTNENISTRLVQDMAVRWNSTLAMISSLFKHQAAVR